MIKPTELPKASLLYNQHHNYADSFEGTVIYLQNSLTATDVAKAFFSSAPTWVDKLFLIRNKLVRVFGLKTSKNPTNRAEQLANFNCEVGQQLGLFKVYSKSATEVIMGENDKHLNFRVSLLVTPLQNATRSKNITITTTVTFNNWFGKIYFMPVRPFHKPIVPTMLKGIIRQLEKNK